MLMEICMIKYLNRGEFNYFSNAVVLLMHGSSSNVKFNFVNKLKMKYIMHVFNMSNVATFMILASKFSS